jgi:hypothetical protein
MLTISEVNMIQRKSEVVEYIKDLIVSFYQRESKKDTICVLCDGKHGNNTLCQMDSRGENIC